MSGDNRAPYLSLRSPMSFPQMLGNVATAPGRDAQPMIGDHHHNRGAKHGLLSTEVPNSNTKNGAEHPMKNQQTTTHNVFAISNGKAIFNTVKPQTQPEICHNCGLFGSLRCSQCHVTNYCSADCQKQDWKEHSKICKPEAKKFITAEKSFNDGAEANTFTEPPDTSGITPRIKEGSRRVMLCDLRAENVGKGTEIQGYVSEFRSPSNFFVQKYDVKSIETLTKLSVLLNNIYSSPENVGKDYVPEVLEVCAAKYSQDQQWCRVLVYNLETGTRTAQVLYLDYGNQEALSFSKLQPMHKDIDMAPPCAMNFRIAHAIVPSCGWSPECLVDVKRLLLGQQLWFHIIQVDQEALPRYCAEVCFPETGKLVHKLMEEKGYLLLSQSEGHSEENCSSETIPVMENSSETTSMKPEQSCVDLGSPKPGTFCVGDKFETLITIFHTPELFFCQQNANQIIELVAVINKRCSTMTEKLLSLPVPGDVCCAQFTEDNNWYRASILKHISDDTAVVGYLDFGNTESLHISRLLPIDNDMLLTPFQATQCGLAGVKPPSGTWSSEVIHTIGLLLTNKVFKAGVVSESNGILSLNLTDESVSPPVVVSEYLIAAGLAEADKSASVSDPTVQKEQKVSRDLPSQLVWEELPLGQEREVMVCMLQSPGDFFCLMCHSTALNSCNDLNICLGVYCKQHVTEDYNPIIGDVCGVLFSDDGNWYRGQVKDLTSGGTATIYFLDYGNTEKVTVDKLCKIPSNFLKLPFQAIKCSLAGVKPCGDEWDLTATRKFENSVAGKKLHAKADSRNENCFSVQLVVIESGKDISDVLLAEKVAIPDDSKSKGSTAGSGSSKAPMIEEASSSVCYPEESKLTNKAKTAPIHISPAQKQITVSDTKPHSSHTVQLNNSASPAIRDYSFANVATNNYKESIYNENTISSSKVNQSDPKVALVLDSAVSPSSPHQLKSTQISHSLFTTSSSLPHAEPPFNEFIPPAKNKMPTSESLPQPLKSLRCPSASQLSLSACEDLPNPDISLKQQSSALLDARGVSTAQSWESVYLPLNEPIVACVLKVRSPDLLYVFPKQNRVDVEKLQQVMLDIFNYCNEHTHQPDYTPSVGDACCAKFSADGQWYRAVVLEVWESTAEIAYADYGNVESLSFSCLRPIKESFLCPPMQITRCRLDGVAPLTHQWSTEGTQALSNLLLGGDIDLLVHSVKAGIYSVSVEKKQETGILYVREKLVMDGLAKRTEDVISTDECKVKEGCCCQELRKRVEKLELLFGKMNAKLIV